MNLSGLKDTSGASANGSAAATIPSLKRTLSGGATPSGVNVHGMAHGLGGHGNEGHPSGGAMRMGVNGMPSVMHANASTTPPQMIRAVTSTGVYNRPSSNTGARTLSATQPSSSMSTANNNFSTSRGNASTSMSDWRMYLTIEERQAVRSKIRDAYASRCNSYEDLLQVACAIEEELLHISAPSRLDYFKSGFEFENRVKLKKDQLHGQLAALEVKRGRPSSSPKPHGSSSSSVSPGNNDATYNKKQRT